MSATKRPTRIWIVVFVLMSLITAGCQAGGDQPGVTTTGQGPGTTAGTGGPPEPVELTVWFGREQAVPADQFASFMDKYPHITVTYDVVPFEDMPATLLRIGQDSSLAPDFYQLHGFHIPTLVEHGLAREVSDIRAAFEAEEPELFATVPNAWADGTYEGQIWGFGLTTATQWMYYRADWFEQLGLDVPTTWDGVLDVARAIKSSGLAPYGYSTMFGRSTTGILNTSVLARQMGVPFGPEGDDVPELGGEAGLYYIEYFQTLWREGLIDPDATSWGFAEMRGAFTGEQAGIYFDGLPAQALSEVFEYKDEWDVAIPPTSRTGADGPHAQAVAPHVYHIHAASEHPFEAGLLYRYLAETPQALDRSLNYNPARSGAVLANSTFQAEFPEFVPLSEAYLDAVRIHYPPSYFSMEEIFFDMYHDIAANPNQNPADIAARYQPRFNEYSKLGG